MLAMMLVLLFVLSRFTHALPLEDI
jgi:hypothetical protein